MNVMVNQPPTVNHHLVILHRQSGRRTPRLRYTNTLGTGWTRAQGINMKRAIELETLQTLVETGAAREFRVLREGEVWRLELRLGSKWLPVSSRREPVRVWRSLTAVGRFCEGQGIKTLTVEL